jgi:hypothetical protein
VFHVTTDDSYDNATFVTSNCSSPDSSPHVVAQPRAWATAAHFLLRPSLHEALNALTIATSHANADAGATSIFFMDGIDVVNK